MQGAEQTIEEAAEAAKEAFDLSDAVQLVTEKLETWAKELVSHIPNLIVALLILLAFWLLGRLAQRLVERALDKFFDNKTITRIAATLTGIAVSILGLFIALEVLNLSKAVTSLLAGAGVIGLALAFAFQDIAANFVSGLMISVRRPFRIGHVIETNDYFGTVQRVDLRNTTLRTPQGQIVLIPNKQVFENPLTNYSREGRRRVDLAVGVSYGEDLEQVHKIAQEAVEGIEARIEDTAVEVIYDAFGGSSIDFTVRFWIPFERQADFRYARSEAVMRIKAAFDRHDIMIPFPIRTLDFGIRGGERLAEVLSATSGGEEATG